ncbi:MAG: cytochrome c peroxidase [Deltaproteobacteria bacterium]
MMRAASLVLVWALASCAPPPASEVIAVGAPLPDLRFEGVDAEGVSRTLALGDWAGEGLLLIVVNGGAWCGTCLHPAELRSHRVARLELVVGDRDNAPADREAAREWQRLRALEVPVGADPQYRLGALVSGPRAALPLMVLVDRRTLAPVDALSNPSPASLENAVERALAELEERTAAPAESDRLIDGLFYENEWALLRTITVPGPPPLDPTNRMADSPIAAALGRDLFFDAGLSGSGELSCASCHRPDEAFSDGRPLAIGAGRGSRRSPSIALASHARWLFWDGRADSLWAQALGPIENPDELASSRTAAARHVLGAYRARYEAVFGAAPDIGAWPMEGTIGDPRFDALDDATQDTITEVFVNIGKALEAFERTLRVEGNALDAYLAGDADALDAEARYGLELFVRSGCMQCHWGPLLTDDAFHVVGMPGPPDDTGRLAGARAWAASDFRGDGRFSDAPSTREVRLSEHTLGQFRTPALRGALCANVG